MVRLLAPREPQLTGVEAFHLGPERVMGTLHQALSWQPECIRRWIDRGRADAEKLIANPQFAGGSAERRPSRSIRNRSQFLDRGAGLNLIVKTILPLSVPEPSVGRPSPVSPRRTGRHGR